MSAEKPTENNSNNKVTAQDLFGSIPKPLDVDPFEGIDMEAISVLKRSVEDDDEGMHFDEFNRLGGFDISDITGAAAKPVEDPDEDDLISLKGLDVDDLSVKKGQPSLNKVSSEDVKVPQFRKPFGSTSSDERSVAVKQKPATETLPGASPQKSPSTPSVFNEFNKVSLTKRIIRTLTPFGKKKGTRPSTEPQGKIKGFSADRLKIGCVYSEVNRVRENIVNALEKANEKTVAFISPHDDAGNTFLISLLGFNIAYFTQMKTLLVDLNMRRPQLHLPFGLEQEQGFTDIISGSLAWQKAVKDTGFSELKMITAGHRDNELYLKLTPDFMENMIHEMKMAYDLVLFDSSPVLNKNRNNVDPVFLSFSCDMIVMVVQDKRTTSEQITNTVEAVTRDGGKIDGIVYNRQF